MKKEFGKNANKGGIYKIINTKNGKFYIGSTKLFKQRANQHQSRLNTKKHHNKHLLNLWNKYGKENFLFEVIEVVEGPLEKRRKIEQEYVDKFWGQSIFLNQKKKVTQKQGSWSSTPEETKRKKSINSKKMWQNPKHRERMSGKNHPSYGKPRSEKVKQAIAKKAKGNKRFLGRQHTEETRKKMSETHKGKIISLEQRQAHSQRMKGRKLTKEHKRKIGESGKGRKQSEHQKLAVAKSNSKTYNVKLISPNDVIFGPIDNASKFCREHKLSPQKLYCVFSGKRPHHKGWKLLDVSNS